MALIIVAVFSLLVAPVNPSVHFGWGEICPKEHVGFCQLRGLQLEIPSPLDRYMVLKELGQGFFGQTWLVSQQGNAVDEFVLKKIKSQVVGHTSFHATAVREQYFGHKMTGDHVGRFLESFDHTNDIYIVSFFDGISLHDLLYDGMEPSSWWSWLKKTDAGREIMRVIIFQLVKAADFCHKKNITHRDLKPSNILICFRKDSGSCSEARRLTGDSLTGIHLRVIDFGSAVDEFSMHHLYPDGPSSAQQTFYMMSPEALFGNDWLQGPSLARAKYDMWTIGQIIMELVLGTQNVFGSHTVETKKILRELVIRMGITDHVLMRVIALSEFCIAVPGLPLYSSSQCSNQSFREYVKGRDPLHLGFMDSSLMHLVRQLLAGNPNQRLTAQEALNHPYFLSSSRDLEVQREEENYSETPKNPSSRLCIFLDWGCFNIEEEKRSRYTLMLERRSEMIKQLKLTL